MTSPTSTGTLYDLHTTAVDEYGIPPYDGQYGRAHAENDQQDPGDYSDPDGMLSTMVRTGSVQIRASSITAPVFADADANASATWTKLAPGANREAVFFPPVHTYARCGAPGTSLASVQLPAGTQVAGQPVSYGTTNVDTTGAALGFPQVGRAELTVGLTKTESTGATSAHARLALSIDARLHSTDGQQVATEHYQLAIGDVRADCPEAPPPPPTPTTTPPPPTTTTTPPPPPPTTTTTSPPPTTTTTSPPPTTTTATPTTTVPPPTATSTTPPPTTTSTTPPTTSTTAPPPTTSTTGNPTTQPPTETTTSPAPAPGQPGGPHGPGSSNLAKTGSPLRSLVVTGFLLIGIAVVCASILLLQRVRLRRRRSQ